MNSQGTEMPLTTDTPTELFHQSLNTMLRDTNDGEVRFGAQGEALRTSQIEALQAVSEGGSDGETMMHIVQPGGVGKTRVGIVLAEAMHRAGGKTLYVVPSQQAVQDFANKARTLCPELDVGTVYKDEKRIGELTFATYASVLRCILGQEVEEEAHESEIQQGDASQAETVPNVNTPFAIDPTQQKLVIWDENHTYLTPHARTLVQRFAHAINIGLTATPRYYAGKEVAYVFGKKMHELDLVTAIKRREISDFRNICITTDVFTGLQLSSPDQEESAQVAKAIDLPKRNNIFPDLYRNAVITVDGKPFTLTGEPTIVFGASITHVHDLAQAFNDTLLPLLKSDELFRKALQEKGINPDTVEQIAAPIHSGGNDEHAAMSLEQRNVLVQRYNERRVLVLTATSVLQQSFDSPITSVVMDTLPRQTYVGVGQAGMRALRYQQDKKMAFIINTQDADHPSLTFLDFQAARGREEGVSVDINRPKERSQRTKKNSAIVDYTVTYGTALVDLAERRKALNDQFLADDFNATFRHFTPAGFQRVNELLWKIGSNNQESIGLLLELILPWMSYTHRRIATQVFGKGNIDEEACADVQIDVLITSIGSVQRKGSKGWSLFSGRMQQDLRKKYENMKKYGAPINIRNLHEKVANIHNQTHLLEDDPQEIAAIAEPEYVHLHETLPMQNEENTDFARLNQLKKEINDVLLTLSFRERDVVNSRYGINNNQVHSLDKLKETFNLSRERIRQIESKAIRKMQEPSRSIHLVGFFDSARNQSPTRQQQMNVMIPREPEDLKDHALFWKHEIGHQLVTQQQIICDILRGSREQVAIQDISERTTIPKELIAALCDKRSTHIQNLSNALDPTVAKKLESYVQLRHQKEELHQAMQNLVNILWRLRKRTHLHVPSASPEFPPK